MKTQTKKIAVFVAGASLVIFISGCDKPKQQADRPSQTQMSELGPQAQSEPPIKLSPLFYHAAECLEVCRTIDKQSAGMPADFQMLLNKGNLYVKNYSDLVDTIPEDEADYLKSDQPGGKEVNSGSLYTALEKDNEKYGVYFAVTYEPGGIKSYNNLSLLVSLSSGQMAGQLNG